MAPPEQSDAQRRSGDRYSVSVTQRRALLTAALGFLQLHRDPPEVVTLRRYLDSWRGLGDVVGGLNTQGYDH
jgi:hypothetical protein